MNELIQYNEPGDSIDRRGRQSSRSRELINLLLKVVLPVCLALVVVGSAVWWGVNSYQRAVEALSEVQNTPGEDDVLAEYNAERIEAVRNQLPFLYAIIFFTPVLIVALTVGLVCVSRASNPPPSARGLDAPLDEWHKRVRRHQER